MKTLLTVGVLIFSLLFFSAPGSACSAFPDGHIGIVVELDKASKSLTISDGETGHPVTIRSRTLFYRPWSGRFCP